MLAKRKFKIYAKGSLTFYVNRRVNISGPLIQEQTLNFAAKQGNTSFKASKGWLESFIKRHNISFGSTSGERGYVKQSTISEWTEKIPTLCSNYKPENIFNMDETGIFFRDSGRKTYRLKGDDCAGGKKIQGANNSGFVL